jgi:signal transduction histidine kinase
MFCTDLAHPTLWIFSEAAPVLLYYSHLPAIFLSIFVSLFIFIKNPKSIPARALLFISVMFSSYLILDLATWTLTNTSHKMFAWSLLFPIEASMYLGTAYFIYSFLENKDAPLKWKIISLALLSPLVILLPTTFTLSGFDFFLCEGIEHWAPWYEYILEGLVSVWIIYYLIRKLFSVSAEIRGKARYLVVGVVIFLVSLLGTNIWGSLTGGNGWKVTQYGFFGVLIFLAVLVYLIVRYGAFNIRLIGAQVLVWALGFGVFSILFITNVQVIQIVVVITLMFVGGAGFLLINSVKVQSEQSEQLKKITKSLKDLTVHLQERVDEQTHEIKKAYLVEKQARENLEELNKAKDGLILTTQHQMRTPLSGTKWTLKMLIDGEFGPLSPEQKSYLIKAFESNDRMIEVVNDMLSAIRLSSAKAGEVVPINLVDLYNKVMFDLDSQVKRKGVVMKMVKSEQPLPVILSEEEKIRLVLQNIIENAIRYSNDGGVVKVSFEPKDDSVLVTVTDHGIGIPQELQKYVFERFFRATNAIKAETDGTGLGLFVTRSILEKINGKIWFESKEGKGTSFYFTIPISKKV